jgi:hypothetical protein
MRFLRLTAAFLMVIAANVRRWDMAAVRRHRAVPAGDHFAKTLNSHGKTSVLRRFRRQI